MRNEMNNEKFVKVITIASLTRFRRLKVRR